MIRALILAALLVVMAVATAGASTPDPPGAVCGRDPNGQPVHCRCLYSDPVGLPVDDPADCPPAPPPTSTTVVDCFDPAGNPCSTTSTTEPSPLVDERRLPSAPAHPIPSAPAFTG